MPDEYIGREQTWLKHRVLTEYLKSWAHKRASNIQFRSAVRLWYVDCFAGPWKNANEDLRDTSVHIGLTALREAAAFWRRRAGGGQITCGAVFVEKRPEAFARLQAYLEEHAGDIRTLALPGEFGEHVGRIKRELGDDDALLFVDPTGWKGADMAFIRELVHGRARRDVLVNFMIEHLRRHKENPQELITDQLADFFGIDDPKELEGRGDEELAELYRERMREHCAVKHVADLRVPWPTKERVYFRLVVGGDHRAVLELFRRIEATVIRVEGPSVRAAAKDRERDASTGQSSMFDALGVQTSTPLKERRRHEEELAAAECTLLEVIGRRHGARWDEVWPWVLERHHVQLSDVCPMVRHLYRKRRIVLTKDGVRYHPKRSATFRVDGELRVSIDARP